MVAVESLVIQIEYLLPKAHITFCVHLILTTSFVSSFDQSVQKCLSIKNERMARLFIFAHFETKTRRQDQMYTKGNVLFWTCRVHSEVGIIFIL